MLSDDNASETWAEFVKSIEQSKQLSTVHPQQKCGYDRKAIKEKKLSERDLNPVSMTYIDEKREVEYLSRRSVRDKDICSRDLAVQQEKYNIISHVGPEFKQRLKKGTSADRKHRTWHLLSQVNENIHKSLPFVYDEDKILALQKDHKPMPTARNHEAHEFDILSNKYLKNHEDRSKQDQHTLKTHIKETYWDTHSIDPIRGAYYDVFQDKVEKEKSNSLISKKAYLKMASFPPR
jgi:hypothetical protein